MKEIWKDVVGYEGLYQVSNIGNVKSLDRYETLSNGIIRHRKGRNLKKGYYSNGYSFVNLRPIKDCKTISIHRLVAMAFIPNPNNYPIVNHLNCIRTDNRVENLEWTTAKLNVLHARTTGSAKFCYIEVPTKIKNEKTGEVVLFENQARVCEYFNHTNCWIGNKYKQVGKPFLYKGWWIGC